MAERWHVIAATGVSMKGTVDFLPGFHEWLAYSWERISDLEQDESGSERFRQSVSMLAGLQQIRQECSAVRCSAETHRYLGSLDPAGHARVVALLHDLLWLLDVSPSAPPSLARQCIRIAQDRIAADLATAPSLRTVRFRIEEPCLEPG